MRRIVGIETEYGLVATSEGRRLPSDDAAARLFAPLAARYATTNAFLGNGGRLYLDIGSHPEYATPECTSAADLVVDLSKNYLTPEVHGALVGLGEQQSETFLADLVPCHYLLIEALQEQ